MEISLPRSHSGGSWSDSIPVSSVGHQPQYGMFGNRDIPFHGDYNRISLADSGDPDHPHFADKSWTDKTATSFRARTRVRSRSRKASMCCDAALTWPRTPRAGTTARLPDAP